MTRLIDTIASFEVAPGSVGLFWLAQAGFAVKTPSRQVIFIDAYLSDVAVKMGGAMLKRLIPTMIEPEEIRSGLWLSTHDHADHLDPEAVPIIARNSPLVDFGGPISCIRKLEAMGVAPERTHLLQVGAVKEFKGFSLRAVYANHGESEPHAIGIVLETDGIRIYHTGDTDYCPERMSEVIGLKPDIIIACINGAYGNLDGVEAARLVNDVGARVAIPSHFWFFVGQNKKAESQPAAFVEACQQFAPNATPTILAVGEPYVYRKA